jgi:LemA protein
MDGTESQAPRFHFRGWIGVLVGVALIAVVGLIGFSWYISGYNRAVRLEQSVKEAWAQVDVVIERRFDLIPNLVEVVKVYAAHEKEIFEHLADARTQYQKAQTVSDKAAAASLFDRALVNVLALAENYPQLRANENFLKLQDSLEGAENRIAVERMRYNAAVQALNTYYRSFFGGFFCRRAQVQMVEFYKAPEVKKEAPKVKF